MWWELAIRSAAMIEDQSGRDLYGDRETVGRILGRGGIWAVVGLSANRARAAFGVSHFLLERGFRVVPVHPSAEVVHGQVGYPTLAAAAAAVGKIDVVDLFVRSSLVGPLVDEAIAIGAGVVWMQQGVVDEAAARRARAAGLLTVMDQCPVQVWHLRTEVMQGTDAGLGDQLAGQRNAQNPELGDPGPACVWVPPDPK